MVLLRLSLLNVWMLNACYSLHGQADTVALRFSTTITSDELREHLLILASDSFMGRDTGKEGQKLAAAYLRERFQRMGVPALDAARWPGTRDGYYQPYRLIESKRGRTEVLARGKRVSRPDHYFYLSEELQTGMSIRRLVVLDRELRDSGKGLEGAHVLLRADKGKAWPFSDVRSRLELIKKRGAASAFVVLGEEGFVELREMAHLGGTTLRLAEESTNAVSAMPAMQVFFIAPTGVEHILGSRGSKKLRRVEEGAVLRADINVNASRSEAPLDAENVLAYIEGGTKREEVVVITAHYDHIGVENGVVYNGADDDGSGTVALLEIAEAFMKAKDEGRGPQRSVLIMPVSGEEKGLLGSRYYSEHPVFPLEHTVANLNIDMIGRVDSAHQGKDDYVYIIGSDRLSTDLHSVNEGANKEHVGLSLDYSFNAADDPNRFYYRSDHYNFARKGVPCIFYFSGVHEDYHQPGDDVDKIRFDLLVKRTRLVFHTAWQLANRPERIRTDPATPTAR